MEMKMEKSIDVGYIDERIGIGTRRKGRREARCLFIFTEGLISLSKADFWVSFCQTLMPIMLMLVQIHIFFCPL